ncbi:hypothetical protein LIER_20365 [Lithospermum erythrorhizon]|uniref:Uncharacterized protein n=1 Tax=Lithospermum erythrorhizon TaxID=34254 RepID=A0AAV3QRX7_LITER
MTSQQISLFRFHIQNRRFDCGTIRVLETLLVSSDVKSLLEIRSVLQELMRSESLRIIREISVNSVREKLLVVEFLVRVFALIDDVESCLALRYEALIMREKEAIKDAELDVSNVEWMQFALQALDNGFHNIARKTFDKALLCMKRSQDSVALEADGCLDDAHVFEKIRRLKDVATVLASSQSVQAQTAEYLKTKTVQSSMHHSLVNISTQKSGSTQFFDGIKRRNIRKLQEHQRLEQISCHDFATDM